VRKARLRLAKKNVDLVLTAARYDGVGSRLQAARGYRRMGDVWSDWLIFSREELVRHLRDGRRLFVGREAELPGDFELDRRLGLTDGEWLVPEGGSSGRDDLAVPLF
jgi:hypothetical protein